MIELLRVGPSVSLANVLKISEDFHITPACLSEALALLKIPTVTIGDNTFINMPALEKAFFVGCRAGEESWVFGRDAPDVAKVGGTELSLDMGLAGISHMACTREELRARLRKMAQLIRRKTLKRYQKN